MAYGFVPMVEVLPEDRCGVAVIEHFDVNSHESAMTAFRRGEFVPEGRYARLRVNGGVMMSDTRMEQVSNLEAVHRATGDVLIAGLGLGLILIPILRLERVSSVTVIEKYADVMALVQGPIRQRVGERAAAKLHVINADIFEWRPPQRGRQYDAIYFDIWPDICVDNLAEITKLRRAFASYLRVGGWAACWKQDELRERARRY
jgi:spermidine synthase